MELSPITAVGDRDLQAISEVIAENRAGRPPMSTVDYLRKQAARCRHFARQILDHDLQRRLLELAEEFERRAEEITQRQGRGEHSPE
jgi:hypothetical protein